MIVTDSIAAMIPQELLEIDVGESRPAIQARLITHMLTKFLKPIKMSKTAVVLINQAKTNIGDQFNPETTPGGRALKFYASLRIGLTQTSQDRVVMLNDLGEEITTAVGTKVLIETIKNKCGIPFRRGFMYHTAARGFENERTLINAAIHKGVIVQNGGHYYYMKDDITHADHFHIVGSEALEQELIKPERADLVQRIGVETGIIALDNSIILARDHVTTELADLANGAVDAVDSVNLSTVPDEESMLLQAQAQDTAEQ